MTQPYWLSQCKSTFNFSQHGQQPWQVFQRLGCLPLEELDREWRLLLDCTHRLGWGSIGRDRITATTHSCSILLLHSCWTVYGTFSVKLLELDCYSCFWQSQQRSSSSWRKWRWMPWRWYSHPPSLQCPAWRSGIQKPSCPIHSEMKIWRNFIPRRSTCAVLPSVIIPIYCQELTTWFATGEVAPAQGGDCLCFYFVFWLLVYLGKGECCWCAHAVARTVITKPSWVATWRETCVQTSIHVTFVEWPSGGLSLIFTATRKMLTKISEFFHSLMYPYNPYNICPTFHIVSNPRKLWRTVFP